MTNNKAVYLTATICLLGMALAPIGWVTLMFFIVMMISLFQLEEEDYDL